MKANRNPATTKLQDRGYYLLLAVATVAFLLLLSGLYKAVLWAIIFTLLAHTLHARIRDRMPGRENLAAGIVLSLVFLLIVVPAIFLGVVVAREASKFVERLQQGDVDAPATFDWFGDLIPSVRSTAEQMGLNLDQLGSRLSESFATGGEFVASQALVFGQGAFKVAILLIVTMYLLFFLLRDGETIRAAIYRVLPIDYVRRDFLIHEAVGITRATIKGVLVIGIIQGTIGGITFALLGLEAAALWGAVMAVASVIPVVGTAIVWGPAALVLLAGGFWVKALVLTGVGVVVIGLVDNVLRPVLVSHDTRMPDYIVLLATLGGISLFGISGFVIGPLIAGIFLASWKIHGDELEAEKADQSPDGKRATIPQDSRL